MSCHKTQNTKNNKIMNIIIENNLTKPFENAHDFVIIIQTVTSAQNETHLRELVKMLPATTRAAFDFGFGGSHFWIREKADAGVIAADRVAIVPFVDYTIVQPKPVVEIKHIEIDDIRADDYYEHLDKYGEHIDTCLISGRKAKITKGCGTYVHMTTDGTIVNTDDENAVDSQGLFPITQKVAETLPASFLFIF